jgi:hypothetical protein
MIYLYNRLIKHRSVDILKKIPLLLVVVLFLALFTHGWNLFQYPYYEGDEGIYVSQAWSFLKQGSLSPYHYWYDHPPLGWITMAAWPTLFGGNFFVFGESSIDNMRVFMLITHVVSALLVYYIAKRLSGKSVVGLAAVVLFTFSPLFVYYQRRVLLDNLMTFWILASYALLLKYDRSLWHIAFSGIFLGIGVLTKIPALVFAPLFLLVLLFPHFFDFASKRSVNIREVIQPAVIWLFAFLCVVGSFLLYTVIKGEFLPSSVSNTGKASFLDGISFQLERKSPEPLLQPGSSFRVALSDWLRKDAFMVYVGAASIIISLFLLRKIPRATSVLLIVVAYLGFMMRGGVVTNFHILPLIPFIVILTVLLLGYIAHSVDEFLHEKTSYTAMSTFFLRHHVVFSTCVLVIVLCSFATSEKGYLTRDETSNHNASIRYIKENFDNETSVMMDVQGLVDLWDPRNINSKTFPRADWFSKLIYDDYIQDYKYEGKWSSIDYVLVSHELLRQMKNRPEDSIANDAYHNSILDKAWLDGADHVRIDEYQSSYGNWAALHQVKPLP